MSLESKGSAKTISKLEAEVEELMARLEDRVKALPAHSIRPHQLLEIEELEDEIKQKQQELARLKKSL